MHVYIFTGLVLMFLIAVLTLSIIGLIDLFKNLVPNVYRGLVNMLHRTDKN